MYTFQALQVLVFLIPGFLASAVLNALLVREEKGDLGRVVEALILGMLIYAGYSFSGFDAPVSLQQESAQAKPASTTKGTAGASGGASVLSTKTTVSYHATGFVLLVTLSCALPVAIATAINNDLHMRLARACRITSKTGLATVWQDAFHRRKGYVVIHFDDGRRLCGWPELYSDHPQKGYIFLVDAAWIADSQEYVELGTQGILVTPSNNIQFIEFLHRQHAATEEIDDDEASTEEDGPSCSAG
ncbi:DUF6338 family protein [Planctomycetota bacterium]